jgi:hypothetical protein
MMPARKTICSIGMNLRVFSVLAAADRSLYGTDHAFIRALDGTNNSRLRYLYRTRLRIFSAPYPAKTENGSGQDIDITTGQLAIATEREHEGPAPAISERGQQTPIAAGIETQQSTVSRPNLVASAPLADHEAAILAQITVAGEDVGAAIDMGIFAGLDRVIEVFAVASCAIATAERAAVPAVPVVAENGGAEAFRGDLHGLTGDRLGLDIDTFDVGSLAGLDTVVELSAIIAGAIAAAERTAALAVPIKTEQHPAQTDALDVHGLTGTIDGTGVRTAGVLAAQNELR